MNLNELEISDTNVNKLVEFGFKPKDRVSYGVKGSEKLAMFSSYDYTFFPLFPYLGAKGTETNAYALTVYRKPLTINGRR